jgi:hypothetical protein
LWRIVNGGGETHSELLIGKNCSLSYHIQKGNEMIIGAPTPSLSLHPSLKFCNEDYFVCRKMFLEGH